ncbi:RNA polymerase sigma factor [Actinomadura rubteroloni]|uniref:RNA polymerase sigma factor n=1 Tax=Actinomadura rubteroloni TaxID=1926885 RepID=A0A2P4UHZ5_9ACTN|nr:hypothetical protein [Actinomadura rubteroloni]POM24689.1 RNA polymerase sigma factor [Actinomadura rubteroloni]
MRGDLGSLFDAHAGRLHAYCWSLLGDQRAADAVADAFVATLQHPPRGDDVLWLYALARSACAERGAFDGTPPAFAGTEPLLRAAAALRADHREALLLWAGEWLNVADLARVLGVAPDTAHQLLQRARSRLEALVLDVLMRGTAQADLDLIEAFEEGRLPHLLARRAPDTAPPGLRDRLVDLGPEDALALPRMTAPNPVVLIGPGPAPKARKSTLPRAAGAVAGVAASVAAAIGILAAWPGGKTAGVSALLPSAGNGETPTTSHTIQNTAANDPTPGRPTPTRDGGPVTQYEQDPAPIVPPAASQGHQAPPKKHAEKNKPGTVEEPTTAPPTSGTPTTPPPSDPPPSDPPPSDPPPSDPPPSDPPPSEQPSNPPASDQPTTPADDPAPSPSGG